MKNYWVWSWGCLLASFCTSSQDTAHLLRAALINSSSFDGSYQAAEKTDTQEERGSLLDQFDFVDPECEDTNQLEQQITKIVGGNKGNAQRWPYLISLQTKHEDVGFRHFCAGVLITYHTLLTTAHCIRQYREQENQVQGQLRAEIYAALMPQCRHQEGAGRRKVMGFYIHQNYSRLHINNDLSLLWLDSITPFDSHKWSNFVDYKAAEKYSNLLQQQNTVTTMGWGAIGFQDATSVLFDSRMVPIQFATLTVIEKPTCDSEILKAGVGNVEVDAQAMLCAQSVQGVDTCHGDSGGPLVIEDTLGDPARDIIIGLTSWGPDTVCGGELILPGVYTKLSNFVDWIENGVYEIQSIMLYTSVAQYVGLSSLINETESESESQSEYESESQPQQSTSPSTLVSVAITTNIDLLFSPDVEQNYTLNIPSETKIGQPSLQLASASATGNFTLNYEASTPAILCEVKKLLQNTSQNSLCN